MAISYKKGEDGIVLLTMDMPNRSVNVLDDAFFEALDAALSKVEADEGVVGVIFTSAKKTFLAGADIDTSFESDDPAGAV